MAFFYAFHTLSFSWPFVSPMQAMLDCGSYINQRNAPYSTRIVRDDRLSMSDIGDLRY